MLKKYILNNQINLEDSFSYGLSPAFKSKNKFIQKEDCIQNSYNEEIKDYDYISIVTKEKYNDGVTIKVKCSFDKFGAPLIVFTDDYKQLEEGTLQYGLHFEVVAYENGCNVWHIVPGKDEKNLIEVTKVDFREFTIVDKSIIDMEVTIKDKKLFIHVNDESFVAEHEDIPSQMHMGITACEGVNRFYEITIDNVE